MIGIWNYTDDETRAAQDISRGEDEHISITMAQALVKVQAFFGINEPSPPINEEVPALVPVHDESAA